MEGKTQVQLFGLTLAIAKRGPTKADFQPTLGSAVHGSVVHGWYKEGIGKFVVARPGGDFRIILWERHLAATRSRRGRLSHSNHGQTNDRGSLYWIPESGFLQPSALSSSIQYPASSIEPHRRIAWISARSASTSAAMLSTIGTARGTTQGSCRPLASSVAGTPW